MPARESHSNEEAFLKVLAPLNLGITPIGELWPRVLAKSSLKESVSSCSSFLQPDCKDWKHPSVLCIWCVRRSYLCCRATSPSVIICATSSCVGHSPAATQPKTPHSSPIPDSSNSISNTTSHKNYKTLLPTLPENLPVQPRVASGNRFWWNVPTTEIGGVQVPENRLEKIPISKSYRFRRTHRKKKKSRSICLLWNKLLLLSR